MILQLSLGTVLILLTVLTTAAGFAAMEVVQQRLQRWLQRPPHLLKMSILLCGSVLWTLLLMTVAVWIWALAFRFLDIFITMEAALYFALVSFTTLGFGDVLLPVEWRLLGGMVAANGFIIFGFVTAILVEALRAARLVQRSAQDSREVS